MLVRNMSSYRWLKGVFRWIEGVCYLRVTYKSSKKGGGGIENRLNMRKVS